MYRRTSQGIQVLLVHPGGPYWEHKDLGAWSIPKGEYAEPEAPLTAAQREFHEETGFTATGPFIPLTPIKQRGGKIVTAWAVEGDVDPAMARSNTFVLEWPPRSKSYKTFPEVDRVAWFDLPRAREKILAGQIPLLDELARHVGE